MELEENDKRMENLLTRMEQNFSKSLDQKFNVLLSKMTLAKDKIADRAERITKVEIIEMYLDEKADKWFRGIKLEKPGLSWTEFGDLLCKRFTDSICKDVVEEFNKLQQDGSVEEYQEKFEELKSLMLIKNRNLDENYFISSFISGLYEEIKPMIRMLKPDTLTETFELSQWQEY
ncbi:uncharacterized protein [Coffea arabica]|uniref:Retrotransposon gag domain-containing protein n=1 Tax=Coffea arabica TaxID=13443 RepID=A0ABM4W343_COFAR